MSETKERFPILIRGLRNARSPTIPWAAIAPHERQAIRNHGQTLRRLADRGGLSWTETLAILTDSEFPWGKPIDEAADRERVLEICGEAR